MNLHYKTNFSQSVTRNGGLTDYLKLLNKMKTILEKTLEAILVLLCIFILGMLPSIFVSIVASIFTDVTFSDCVQFPPFWIFSLLGWFIAGGYIDHVIKRS